MLKHFPGNWKCFLCVASLAEQINHLPLGNVVGLASANLIGSVVHRGVPDSLQAGPLAEPREGDGFDTASVAISPGLGSHLAGEGWALHLGFLSKLLLCGGKKFMYCCQGEKNHLGGFAS